MVFIFLCFIVMLFCIPVESSLTNCNFFILILYFILFVYVSIFAINKNVNIQYRNRYISCYFISFLISLLLLLFCWSPYLSPNSKEWGFDPQRYYIYAIEILNTGDFDGWVGSGFNGVIYFYSYLFGIFGYHPLIPLFLNMLLCLLSTLAIRKIFMDYINEDFFWILLLIPEVIYYNVTPGKDTNCMYGVVFLLYSFCSFNSKKSIHNFILCSFSLLFLSIFRFPYALVLLVAYVLYLFFSSDIVSKSVKLLVGSSVIGITALLFVFVMTSGLVDLDVINLDRRVDDIVTANIDSLEGGSALAAKLTPKTPMQVIVFGILRSFIYLFPEMYYEFFVKPTALNFVGLFAGVSGCILPFFIYPVFLNIYYVLRNLDSNIQNVDAIQNKKIIIWFFLSLFFLVAFSTPHFIHQRYRLAYDMLYVTLAIIAYNNFGKERFQILVRKNGAIIIIAVCFYIVMKMV